jgi:transmembrane sensor
MTDPRRSSTVPLYESEPLAGALDDGLDEARIKSMWERIDHTPSHARRPWILAMVTAAAVLLLLVGVSRFAGESEPRQLTLVSGVAPVVLGSEKAAVMPRFDDGSLVSLASGTRLEVLRNDARSFVTALRRGDATFDVKPGGPRHWVIEAGELSVEVVGTRFRVERGAESTRVSVDHGIVLVRGERVPGGSVRLTAGKHFELLASAEAARPAIGDAPAPAAPVATVPAPAASSIASSPAASDSATPVVAGEPTLAAPSAQPEARDEVELALRAADVARREHDGAAAIRYFDSAFRQAAPGDRRRGLAGLSLARLLMAQAPAKAAGILRSSLSDMPQALLEDATVRLVEAESRSGNIDAARQAAADYRRRFPAGRREDEVRRWSEP